MTERQVFAVRVTLLWMLLELMAAAQVRTSSGRLLLAAWLDAAVTPVVWLTDAAQASIRGAVAAFTSHQTQARENHLLRRELEFSLAQNLLIEDEVAALRELAGSDRGSLRLHSESVVARCVFRNLALGRLEVRAVERLSIPRDTPVVGAGGLVGRVVGGGGRTAWVELIIHPAAAVAVQSPDGTVQSIAAGTGGAELEVHYVSRSAPLTVDTLLVTSGADGIYPFGIPVATVSHVRERESAFLEVRARPTAGLSTARIVLLLTGDSRLRRPAERP